MQKLDHVLHQQTKTESTNWKLPLCWRNCWFWRTTRFDPWTSAFYFVRNSNCDLMKRIQLRYRVYADDTLILSTLRQQTLEHDIKDLDTKMSLLLQAFSQMKLRVNPDKTEVMLISSRKQKLNLAKLDLAGENLALNPSFKSLGITIDQYLSLTRHINSVTASCYNELCKLYKIRHYLTIETRKLVVQNLIISRLDYCNSVLSGVPKTEIMKFQRVQNAACRFIFSLKNSESCKDFMYHLHWLPIDKRIDFKVLIFVHKIIHNVMCRIIWIILWKFNLTSTGKDQ